MSYLVLARKYRPQRFDEMIGQEHITDIIKKAITSERIAHAYLFCGPRGIGKTSCARILAKALNCAKGPTLTPCGTCPACKEIAAGTSFDVLEIDGASNRGIEEIRTLRENVKFAPSYGRYKVYIVDEVHMLTTEAFNALLKTLEEPPPHVKFIFATTAPQKLPSTIISRCQKFDFKRISLTTISSALKDIARREKFTIDEAAFLAVAKAAEGSLRDALSILDQVSALSAKSVKADDIYTMLGLVETELLFEMSGALAAKNCTAALESLDKIIEKGKDLKQLTRDLVEHFRNLMIIKIGGKTLSKLIDYPAHIKDQYLAQSEGFSLKEILQAIELLINAQEIARITESARMALEVTFAQLTYQPEPQRRDAAPLKAVPPSPRADPRGPEILAKASEASGTSGSSGLKNEKGQWDISGREKEDEKSPAPPTIDEAPAADAPDVVDFHKIKAGWDALTHAVSRSKMSVATFLQDGAPCYLQGNDLTISFAPSCKFQKETLESKENKALVEKVFSEKLNVTIYVKYILADNHAPKEEDPIIKSALDTFKGKVVNRWHNE
ncbi:MAG: DNA polymerase III subunit gamma/tau [Candidatus Omnitrophota bacterium]|nr:DNA polymerase III subunit gamma/tau [Candidatus Omnitrophota bacterium]